MAEGDSLVSVDYEVFGKVQGVFFRKYTQVCGLEVVGICYHLIPGHWKKLLLCKVPGQEAVCTGNENGLQFSLKKKKDKIM